MKTIQITKDMEPMNPCVATIGFFDGVHRGHQYLIRKLIADARAEGMESTVITFDLHPRKVLQSDYQPRMLSTLSEKLLLLSKTSVDNTALLHFDEEMARMTAREFMEQILRDKLNVRKLYIGYDHRFGHDRKEGFDDYVRYGRELGMEVVLAQAFELNGVNVSSSVVRSFLEAGEVEMAEMCLGYPYTIVGKVVKGDQEGRKMGFPTANLDTTGFDKLIPAPGVYAVKVRLENSMEMKRAMMNIGVRPTFGGTETTLETYILNFGEDIYGKMMLVSFAHRIREEQRFPSAEALREQLERDEKMVEEQFEKDLEHE